MTYKIIRMYQNSFPDNCRRVIKSGLTLEEAQEHCRNPETSSNTCRKARNVQRTKMYGPWFDSFTEE
jgi:hypothetical protein